MESALYSKPTLFREEDPMCDYSLAHFRSRLGCRRRTACSAPIPQRIAESGFPGSGSEGVGLPLQHHGRVCPPGARLLLRDIPKSLQPLLGVGEVEEVTFIQQVV